MGKKPQRHSWPEAKKLCRLNQFDIVMAKRLGFGPDALIRARPDPKQKWKLPVKYWVQELYFKRYGEVLGEKRIVPPQFTVEYDEEAARRFEEELYWDDYWDRNQDSLPSKTRKGDARKTTAKANSTVDPLSRPEEVSISDEDTPF